MVNGQAVTSGQASLPQPLVVGSNSIPVLVTAQDGTHKTYTLTVTRAPSNDAYLAIIALPGATLSPAFAFKTLDYNVTVPNSTSTITVVANVLEPNATFTVNTLPGTAKVASAPITLAVGSTTITIVVTAQDGVTKQTYTLTVTRLKSSNDNLASLGINKGYLVPGFTAANISYNAAVGNGVSTITLTPTTAD